MRNDNPLGLKPFDEAEYLTDENTIAEYLNAAAEIGDPAVLLEAFAVVGRARGMAELAKKAGLGRESLYKALAPGAHPRYDTIFRVAQALGVNFHFTAPEKVREPRKKVPAPAKTLRRAAAKKTTLQSPRNEQRAVATR